MKKVAFYIISDGIGGAEQVVWQTLMQLRGKVDLFLIVNNEIAEYYENVIEKERILNIGDIYLHLNRKYKFIRYVLNNRYFSLKSFIVKSKTSSISNFIRGHNIEILHSHLEYALFSSIKIKRRRGGLKLFYTVHSAFGFKDVTPYAHQIIINKREYAKIDHMVFVSQYVQNLYIDDGFSPVKHNVIYNGLEFSSFKNNKKKILPEKHIILFVGGEKEVKGYDLLVQTVILLINQYKFTNFIVWVLGIVSEDGLFKKLVKENNLQGKFEFKGFIKQPEHLEYFEQASILFMPSRTEAMPMAAIEAVFCNLPIIATNIGGIPEIVHSGHNGYCSDLNPVDFAYNINSLLHSYEVIKLETEIYNQQLKVKFNLESVCNKLLEIYNSY